MSIGRRIGGRHGFDLFERARGRIDAWNGSRWHGYMYPANAIIAGRTGWIGRLDGQEAVGFDNQHAALAHILGGCPDCTCEPILCANDETGESCLDCPACVHGCPEDICNMQDGPSGN